MSTKAKSNSAKKAVKKVAKKEAKHSYYIAYGYNHDFESWEISDICTDPVTAAGYIGGSGTDIKVLDLGVLEIPAETTTPPYKLVKVSA